MGHKNRLKAADLKAKRTQAKVRNKRKEREGKHGQRAKKQALRSKGGPDGEMEKPSRKLRKYLKRRAIRDRIAQLGQITDKDAPVRPEDLDLVLSGKARAKDLAVQIIEKGKERVMDEIKSKKMGSYKSSEITRIITSDDEEEEKTYDGTEEEASDDGDDEAEDGEKEETEEAAESDIRVDPKELEQIREKRIEELSKPITVLPHVARSLKAKGIDPTEWVRQRNAQRIQELERLKRERLAKDIKQMNRVLAEAKIKRKATGEVDIGELSFSSDSDEYEDEESILMRVAGSWQDLDLENGPTLAQIRAQRKLKGQAKRKRGKDAKQGQPSRLSQVDSPTSPASRLSAMEDSVVDIKLDGPDSGDEGGNVFDDLSGAEGSESENTDGPRKDAMLTGPDSDTNEDSPAVKPTATSSAKPGKRTLKDDDDEFSSFEQAALRRSMEKLQAQREQEEAAKQQQTRKRLPVRTEDGEWKEIEVDSEPTTKTIATVLDQQSGLAVDADGRLTKVDEKGKVLTKGLEKYKRKTPSSDEAKQDEKQAKIKRDSEKKLDDEGGGDYSTADEGGSDFSDADNDGNESIRRSRAAEKIAQEMGKTSARIDAFKLAALTEVEYEKQRIEREMEARIAVLQQAHELQRRAALVKATVKEGTEEWHKLLKRQQDEIEAERQHAKKLIKELRATSEMQSEEARQFARSARIRRIQISLASLCQEILADPEQYITAGNLSVVIGVARNDVDLAVRQMALISATQVLIDVVPMYRIRIPTQEEIEKEKQTGVILSREVLQTRRYEKQLVKDYTDLVRLCCNCVRKVMASDLLTTLDAGVDPYEVEREALRGLPLVALKNLCRLFERAYNFNYAKEICAFLSSVLTSRFVTFRDIVASTVRVIFKSDIAGDASLEIVRAISNVFKERGGDRIRSTLLEVLLDLPLDREILTAEEERKRPGGGTEVRREMIRKNIIRRRAKPIVKGAGNHALNAKLEAEYRARLEAKGKLSVLKKLDEERARERSGGGFGAGTTMKLGWAAKINKLDAKKLEKDLAEADAEVSIMHRKKVQTALLSAVFTIYFRYLKQAPSLKSLYERNPEAKQVTTRVGFKYSSSELEEKKRERDAREAELKAKGEQSPEESDAAIAAKDGDAAKAALAANEAYVHGVKVTLGEKTGVPAPPPPPPSHLILKAVLDGVNKFAHLINLELLLDLLEHLKLVIAASARVLTFTEDIGIDPLAQRIAERLGISEQNAKLPEVVPHKHAVDQEELANQGSDDEDGLTSGNSESTGIRRRKRNRMAAFVQGDKIVVEEGSAGGVLPLQSALLCVYTAFQLLKIHNYAIRIDLSAYYKFYYELLWQLSLPEELPHLPLALQCFELMMLEQREVPPARAAALCRRMLIISLLLKPNVALPLVHAVGMALLKHPRVQVILDNEAHATGQYDPTLPDPDLACGLGSPAWELALWAASYHPFGEPVIAQATNTPQIIQLKSNREAAAKVAKELAEAAHNARMDGTHTTVATTQVNVKIGDDHVSLSRFRPGELLKILDATRGGFVPDIEVPKPHHIAITFPDQVSSALERQAVNRARNHRSQVAQEPLNVRALLPRAWQKQLDAARVQAGFHNPESASSTFDPTTKSYSPANVWPLSYPTLIEEDSAGDAPILGQKRMRSRR